MRSFVSPRGPLCFAMLALLSLVAVTTAEKPLKPRDLYELSPSNFDARTRTGSWLLMFAADWCGHCKRAKPLFKEAGKQLREKAQKEGKEPVKFGLIDADRYKSLAARFGVNGFPTFWHITANGTEARRAQISSYTTEGFSFYAEKGWKKDAVAPHWSGPQGPFGQAKFYLLLGIDKVLAFQEPIEKATGVPGPIIAFVLMLAGVALSTFALMACAVWLGPTKKRAPVQKPVRSAATAAAPAPPAPGLVAAPSTSSERKED
jgi:thiol-disulfide isomerase/thioredoxin